MRNPKLKCTRVRSHSRKRVVKAADSSSVEASVLHVVVGLINVRVVVGDHSMVEADRNTVVVRVAEENRSHNGPRESRSTIHLQH